ncbi:MAG: RDD family protein [Planctomycetota bacterium]|nr:MAG: RDD family protein [Planctomycetota bacterium]
MTNGRSQLDTTIEVVTPENVLLQYQVCGPFRRLIAFALDVGLRIAVFFALWMVVGIFFGFLQIAVIGVAIMVLVYFVFSWFYGGLFEAYWNGQTPGKRVMGIRVLTLTGEPINALQAILRNVLRVVDALPPFLLPLSWFIPDTPAYMLLPGMSYLAALVSMTCTEHFQRLGDLPTGTMVVVEQRRWHHGLVKIDEPLVVQLASELPANLEISRSLGKTLAHYVERRRVFPPARRADLSRHVGTLLVKRLGLPEDTSHDLLLCAIYYRTFISDQLEDPLVPEAQVVEPPRIPFDDEAPDLQTTPTATPTATPAATFGPGAGGTQ